MGGRLEEGRPMERFALRAAAADFGGRDGRMLAARVEQKNRTYLNISKEIANLRLATRRRIRYLS
jgi:hypothetical protein